MIQYIFSINPGRVGSKYLSNLFKHIENCSSFHEPDPIMNGKPMQDYLFGDKKPILDQMPHKIESIRNLKNNAKYYIETNHCFIKGFGWHIPQYINEEEIGIVILKRDIEETVRSFIEVDTTCFTPLGENWTILPGMKNRLTDYPKSKFPPLLKYRIYKFLLKTILRRRIVKILTFNKFIKLKFIENYEIDMLKWYVRETYELAELYKKTYPGIKCIEIQIEDLNSPDAVSDLLKQFDINEKFKASFYDVINTPINLREKMKHFLN